MNYQFKNMELRDYEHNLRIRNIKYLLSFIRYANMVINIIYFLVDSEVDSSWDKSVKVYWGS